MLDLEERQQLKHLAGCIRSLSLPDKLRLAAELVTHEKTVLAEPIVREVWGELQYQNQRDQLRKRNELGKVLRAEPVRVPASQAVADYDITNDPRD